MGIILQLSLNCSVGRVIGRFYDAEGHETSYNEEVRELILAAQSDKDEQDEEKKMFPPCNSEWSKKKGHRLWCTNKSGGITRNWIGRYYFGINLNMICPFLVTHRCLKMIVVKGGVCEHFNLKMVYLLILISTTHTPRVKFIY